MTTSNSTGSRTRSPRSQCCGPRSAECCPRRGADPADRAGAPADQRTVHRTGEDRLDSERRRELWTQITALLREDVRDEEDVLLPRLQAAVGRRQLTALGLAWEAIRRTAPTRPHPVVARRPPGNALAAPPLLVIDRTRDHLDRWSRRAGGSPAGRLRTVSAGLARVAGAIEHLPPLTRGEDPSTATRR